MVSFLTLGFLFLVQGLPPLIGPLIPETGGKVTGVIRTADTRQPIPSAQVAVVVAGTSVEAAMTRAVATDRDGRFTVRALDPGQYVVIVQAEGYFSPGNDPASAGQAKRDLRVLEGLESDVGIIELVPGAAISGRISGQDGVPVIGASVQAWRASYLQGQLTFTLAKTAETNDRGEYRLFWLVPGEYYVASQYRSAVADRSERYKRVFFPGILEEESAPAVTVGAGREVSGIDLQIPLAPVAGATISGQVAGEAAKLANLRIASVQLVPRARRVLLADDGDIAFSNRLVASGNGRFEIHNVPPGQYTLFPIVGDGDNDIRLGHVPVDVADRNVENLSVALDLPVELKGRVTLDDVVPGDSLKERSILLVSMDVFAGKRSAQAINPDSKTGEFAIQGLAPGRYLLQMSAGARTAGVYIADVKRTDVSVRDSGFAVGSDFSGELSIQLKSMGGIVSGTVLDVSRIRPFSYATVALLPERSRRGNYTLYMDTIGAADGRFSFMGVPPGNYVLFAWQAVVPGAWQNPMFLGRYEDRGVPVAVENGAERSVQVVVIP